MFISLQTKKRPDVIDLQLLSFTSLHASPERYFFMLPLKGFVHLRPFVVKASFPVNQFCIWRDHRTSPTVVRIKGRLSQKVQSKSTFFFRSCSDTKYVLSWFYK